MFVRNMGMYTLLFFVFFVVIGLTFDIPVSKFVTKLCKGNESNAKIVVILVFGVFSYVLVKMIGAPIVDFLENLFGMEFQRFYN